MIEWVYKGILIGILVSAPMGPIGLLCIQRTLNRGRWHGLATGVGAVFSDLFYAAITGLGMGIVLNFIEKNQTILQIVGSVLLMTFGYYIFKTNPARNLRKRNEQTSSFTQDSFTSFLLTLSNPFIIFLYIGLFARFDFISTDKILLSVVIGLLGIAIGAALWWFLITYLVDKLRGSFNLRGLWILNRIVGSIIIFLSVVGLGFSLFEYFTEQTLSALTIFAPLFG